MRATALKKKEKLFHAKVLVTRIEEWCVEAATAEQARGLLETGAGHQCAPGEPVHIELERLLDD